MRLINGKVLQNQLNSIFDAIFAKIFFAKDCEARPNLVNNSSNVLWHFFVLLTYGTHCFYETSSSFPTCN